MYGDLEAHAVDREFRECASALGILKGKEYIIAHEPRGNSEFLH